MDSFLEGILLLPRMAWVGLGLLGQGIAALYRTYMILVGSLGQPWTNMVHSTVFLSIGQTIAWLLFGL